MIKRRSKEITIKPTIPLQKITSDLAGPITPPSLGGNKYVIFFLDAASRYIDFKLLKQTPILKILIPLKRAYRH